MTINHSQGEYAKDNAIVRIKIRCTKWKCPYGVLLN